MFSQNMWSETDYLNSWHQNIGFLLEKTQIDRMSNQDERLQYDIKETVNFKCPPQDGLNKWT